MVRTPACGADDPGSIPVGARKKEIYFLAAFQCFGGALKAVGPVGQEP